MLRIRHVSFWVVSGLVLGCSGDDGTPSTAGESGGALVIGAPTGGTASSSGGTAGSTSGNGGSQDTGGAMSSGGATASGGAGNGGAGNGGAGTPSTGGSGSGAGGTGSGGTSGTGGASGAPTNLPPGALCANDGNCGQTGGAAVCCAIPGCGGPCECRLKTNCPTGSPFLECNNAADCAAYGGGKVCCKASSGGQTMQYCTKQSGCAGTTLP